MNIFDEIVQSKNDKVFANYINNFSDVISVPGKGKSLSSQSQYPNKPGVYCLFEDDNLVYVEETVSLKERLKDIFRTKNHSFRRSLGKRIFSDITGVSDAGYRMNFPPEVEIKLTRYMESNIIVVFAPVLIGRKEIEESIVTKHRPIYNLRGQRGQ